MPLEEALAEPDLPPGREGILRLESEIAKMPQVECPLRHIFSKGLYVREFIIPKGVILTGAIHLQECITTLAKGKVLMTEGGEAVCLTAPYVNSFAAGTKKAIFALEDSVWIDAYPNPDDERDTDVLEDRLMTNSHLDYLTRPELLLEKS
jgi:hypothetical protein